MFNKWFQRYHLWIGVFGLASVLIYADLETRRLELERQGSLRVIHEQAERIARDSITIRVEIDKLMSQGKLFNWAFKLQTYYIKTGSNPYNRDVGWLLKCVTAVNEWGNYWGYDDTKKVIFLSAINVESGYDPLATGNKDELGITQTREQYLPRFNKIYLQRGISLPMKHGNVLKDVNAQVAYGMLEWKEKMDAHENDPWESLRYYNGDGDPADAYVHKVRMSYKKIFGGKP